MQRWVRHFAPPPSITAIGFLPHSNTASAASRAACIPRWVELKSSIPGKQCQLMLRHTALCQERESTK